MKVLGIYQQIEVWPKTSREATIPTGEDIFAITKATHPEHGGLMSKVLQTIAYSKRFTPSARQP
jgi:hypothetical protein